MITYTHLQAETAVLATSWKTDTCSCVIRIAAPQGARQWTHTIKTAHKHMHSCYCTNIVQHICTQQVTPQTVHTAKGYIHAYVLIQIHKFIFAYACAQIKHIISYIYIYICKIWFKYNVTYTVIMYYTKWLCWLTLGGTTGISNDSFSSIQEQLA